MRRFEQVKVRHRLELLLHLLRWRLSRGDQGSVRLQIKECTNIGRIYFGEKTPFGDSFLLRAHIKSTKHLSETNDENCANTARGIMSAFNPFRNSSLSALDNCQYQDTDDRNAGVADSCKSKSSRDQYYQLLRDVQVTGCACNATSLESSHKLRANIPELF